MKDWNFDISSLLYEGIWTCHVSYSGENGLSALTITLFSKRTWKLAQLIC
jgi:hypothetical protein